MTIWGICFAHFLASDLAVPNVDACWGPGTAFQILACCWTFMNLLFFSVKLPPLDLALMLWQKFKVISRVQSFSFLNKVLFTDILIVSCFLNMYALFVPGYRPFIIHVSKFAVEEIIFNTPLDLEKISNWIL